MGRIAVLAFFVDVRVKLIFKVEGKKGGQDHIAQINTPFTPKLKHVLKLFC